MKYLVMAICCLFTFQAECCSTFLLDQNEEYVFGKNYDWMVEDGYVIVNKRDICKTAFVSGNPVRWVSRYGSLTFNQYGREFPSGGINEKGLVVELMRDIQASYPQADERPELLELQWIQYQLDTSVTVEEVIASHSQVRIAFEGVKGIHFLVADRSGNCATIEFYDGKLVAHRRASMPVTVLTNDPYSVSIENLENYDGFGGSMSIPMGSGSLDRFVRIATALHHGYGLQGEESPVNAAFIILSDVADSTQWSIVYHIPSLSVSFRTASNPSLRSICLGAFEFDSETLVLSLDLLSGGSGDVSHQFEPYSTAKNLDLIERVSRADPFFQTIPPELREALALYPESTHPASASKKR